MGASVGLPAAVPLLIRFYVRKHTRGGGKQKIIVMDSGPVLILTPSNLFLKYPSDLGSLQYPFEKPVFDSQKTFFKYPSDFGSL